MATELGITHGTAYNKRSRASAGNTRPGHFTTASEAVMQLNPTDVVRSKEELVLDLVREGRVTIDADGAIWKHWRMLSGGKKQVYDQPLRADFADKLGYCRCSFHVGKKQYVVYAHRLVWVSRNGAVPNGVEINHKDGNKSNNRLTNLELVTHTDNARHAYHKLGKGRHLHLPEVREKLKRNTRRPAKDVDGVPHYRCTKCDTWKAKTEFGRLAAKNTVCGIMSACRECSNKDRRACRSRTGK